MLRYPLPGNRSYTVLRSVLTFGLALSLAAAASAQAPLHQRIDRLIAASQPDFEAGAAPPASDAEFLRRIYLDLAGTIPTIVEARAFLADKNPDKRTLLIDRLLAAPEHARHLANVFDVLLMERRPDKHVPRAQWQEYLRASFQTNKPWDQLVREVLGADGADPKLRPAAKFYLDRDGEPNLLTRDIARLFLGINLQCAQCHDHPLVADYKQSDYYGLFAFLNRSFLFNDKGTTILAEKAEGEVSFQSVFDPSKVTKTTGPRLPHRPPVPEPALAKGKEYAVAPAKGVRPVPKFSRRALLPARITDRESDLFRRNIVNRLWALMMGRGLVHPVDLLSSGNPPSHPELLNLLADEFAAMNFDLRAFQRELALTRTYQRSSERPAPGEEMPPERFVVAPLKPLSPEQLALALLQATGMIDVERQALGKNLNEATLYARLAGNLAPIVATFGSSPGQAEGQGFQATLDQALFLENGNLIRGWLNPRAGNLTDRLARLKDVSGLADELYLSILTRPPLEDERREVADYLKNRTDRPAALQELTWALLASAEFRFSH